MITKLTTVSNDVVIRANSLPLISNQSTATSWLKLLSGDTSINGVSRAGAVNGRPSNEVTPQNGLPVSRWLRLLGGEGWQLNLNGRANGKTASEFAVQPVALTAERWIGLLSRSG